MSDKEIAVKADPLGASGVELQSGYFQEEYLSELEFSGNAYCNYDKMRRQDYEIKRVLRAINNPILSANYDFLPEDPEDEEQIKQSEFKKNILMKWMCKSWTESLQDILSYLVFGFAVFEPTIHVVEDREFGEIQVLKNLGFRKQLTITDWKLDQDGNVESVEQEITGTDNDLLTRIPGKDLLIFTNDREGDNYEGVSIIRTSYGPYKRKLLYEKIDMIGIEKMAVGTPVAFLPPAVWNDTKEFTRISNVLKAYSAHEKQYIAFPETMKDNFEIVKGEYNSDAVRKSIDGENHNITKSVMASFLDIGTMARGGDKQTGALIDVFLNSVQFIGDYVCEKLDPLVHQIYVMNFGEPEVKLHLKCSNINKKNLPEMAEVLNKLSSARILTPDDLLEQKVRKDLDLPMKEETDDSSEPDTDDAKQPEEDKEPEDREEIRQESSRHLQDGFSRELTQFEKKLNLKSIQKDFKRSEDEYEDIILKNVEKMKGKFLNDLKNALKQSNRDRAVMNIKLGFTAQFENEMKSFMKNLVSMGEQQMARDMNAEKLLSEGDGVVRNLLSRIGFTSKRVVNDVQDRFENSGTLTALDSLAEQADSETVIDETEKSLNDLLKTSALVAGAGAIVNQFINTGRNNFAYSNKKLLQGFQYSAVIDSNTTNICRSLDKQTFSAGDGKAFDLRPPLHWNCRSILVPILTTEDPVELSGLKVKPVQRGSQTIGVREVLKSKQFEDKHLEIDYESMPVGHRVERDGKFYVKDYDGKFRLA